MYKVYSKLKVIVEREFRDIVSSANFVGGRTGAPNKLRIFFVDNSFLDVWLSEGGDYSFHWEHRAQRGLIHRWDNAPDHPELATFPEHFHNGSDKEVKENELSEDHEKAITTVLGFIQRQLAEYGFKQ
jgi:hypothetical protein